MNTTSKFDTTARYLPFAFALAFFLQGLFGSLGKSLTWDEPVFIASGYSYLTRDDFRMNIEAPPLLQHLHALPLLNMQLKPVSETDPLWQQGEHILFSRKFLLENGDRIREIALRARLPILLIGTCLVLAVAFWGRRLYGPTPALAASALAAFSPNLIAHAKLATTDLGCTAAMFLSVFTCYQAIEKNTHTSWFLCGFVTGLALLTKFTALLLGPIYLVLGGMFYFQKRISFRHLLRGAFIVTMLSILTIGAGYNLTFNLSLYFEGLSKIYSNARPGYLFYLHGELSETPWWYYYLATLYLKVPLPVLVLVALSLFYLFKTSQHRDTALVLLIPILVILIATCFDQSNLGLRRILPVLPFLFLFCAHSLAAATHRLIPYITIALIILTAIETLSVYPHHLTYFSRLVGGPEKGLHCLDDSNIDWGQDLPALAKWQKAHPEVNTLKLEYFGTLPSHLYGVKAQEMSDPEILHPQPGTYAISTHSLIWFRKLKKKYPIKGDIDWLTRYKPIAKIGSIYIYQFPQKQRPQPE